MMIQTNDNMVNKNMFAGITKKPAVDCISYCWFFFIPNRSLGLAWILFF